jgi:hypothetical protein
MRPATLSAVTRAAAKAASASQARDDAIRKAHADGATLRAIAAAAGLSFARIHQIVNGR